MEVGCEEEIGGSRHFLLLYPQLSYSRATVPEENSHLKVHGASASQAGCDQLCLLAMRLVTWSSVAWRLSA